MIDNYKKEAVDYFLNKGFLINPDLFDVLPENFDKTKFFDKFFNIVSEGVTFLNKDLFLFLEKNNEIIDINWEEFEKSKALFEKGKNGKIYDTFSNLLNTSETQISILKESKEESDYKVKILKSYKEDSKKRKVDDFVSYLRKRYDILKNILKNREDLQDVISISRIERKNNREDVKLIGIVNDKITTKNGNIILVFEDPTGIINVLISKDKDIYNVAKDVVLDEVIGINGICGGGVVFCNNIYFPDAPMIKELKKYPEEVYVAFISDTHIGSKKFLEEDFLSFIDWLNGNSGNLKQKDMAKKIKYLFIVGDIIDGIGIYPNQEKDLEIKDVYLQYKKCAELFSKIRKDIAIIMCPGQHDATRIAEPQPKLSKEVARHLYELPNLYLVSNPAYININQTENFPGFNVLMYHGASFHYYIDNVESLRNLKARKNPSQVLKFLLKKRHLAPTHTSNLYVPVVDEDPLVIDDVPDIICSGEVHKSDVGHYNNVTLINCSCFQGYTDYQEKTGNIPDPSRVPIINLKTREVSIINFRKDV